MRESELLEHIRVRSAGLAGAGGVVVGPGDDCAVLLVGDGLMLATVDQLIDGRHFRLGETAIDMVARKAVARSVSDIAAMGGIPRFALATGALPRGFERGDALFERMHHWGNEFGCPLVGGDIAMTDGPMVLTVTVLGVARGARGPVLRAGARVGDGVFVTGALGGSFNSGRHLSFVPRVTEGQWLCDVLGERLGAMIDLSDGVGRDGGRVADASGVCIEIEAGWLPRHAGVVDWRAAVSDGEDYELLFTASGDVPGVCPATGVSVTRIGVVSAGSGCVVVDGSARVDVRDLGWDHRG